MMLKQLILLLCALGAIAKPEVDMDQLMQQMSAIHDVCVKETNVDEDHIEQANAGVFIEDGNLGCYLKCMNINFGVMDNKGNIVHKAVDQFPADIKPHIKNMLEACKEVTNRQDDLCKKAYELHHCAQKSDPEHYFVV